MVLNKKYTGTVSSIEKSGRGFTSTNGTKYVNYKVIFEEYPTSFQMAVRKDIAIEAGDKLSFVLKLDKKNKIRVYDVKILKYEIKFPLRDQPTYLTF